jgi:ribosomal protein L13
MSSKNQKHIKYYFKKNTAPGSSKNKNFKKTFQEFDSERSIKKTMEGNT